MAQFQLVASSGKRYLYAIGDFFGASVYRLSCNEYIQECKWEKTDVQMKYERQLSVAMRVPDEFASQICN